MSDSSADANLEKIKREREREREREKIIKNMSERDFFKKEYAITIAIFIAAALMLSYTKLLYKKHEYLDNWSERKCRAEVLPIGGFIKHDEGDNIFEKLNKTGKNFRECVADIKGSGMDSLLAPFHSIVNKLMSYNSIFSSIYVTMKQFFQKMIDVILVVVANLGKLKDFFLGILNVVLLCIKSIMDVFISIFSGVYEIIITIYDIFKFFVGKIGELLKTILIATWISVSSFFVLAGIFYALSFIPFAGIGFLVTAQAFTVLGITTTAIATALTIVSDDLRTFFSQLANELETPEAKGDCVKWDSDVWEDSDCEGDDRMNCFDDEKVDEYYDEVTTQKECAAKWGNKYTADFTEVSSSKPYGWLFCFHPDTILTMKNNEKKKIKDIGCGEFLKDGARVTATMKLNAQFHTMYNFHDIIITGSHRVKTSDGAWVRVERHPDSILIGTMPISEVYCLNTDTKIIRIGEHEFMDWDEIGEMDMIDLKRVAKDYLPRRASNGDIHKYLDSGFHGDTLVELDDGRSIKIKDLEINHVLRFDERIVGVVKIDTKHLDCVKKYKYKGFEFTGGPNMSIYDECLGTISSLNIDGEDLEIRPKCLYHVFTDRGGLIIGGKKFYDYNSAMELFLDEPCVFFHDGGY